MTDDKGKRINSAGPSVPVEITGLSEVPDAGDIFNAVEDERMARSYPGSLWRLTCEDAPALRHDAAFTFRKNPGGACGTSPVGKSAKATKEEP